MLYIVSNSHYESYRPTIIEGPNVGDFEEYCKKFYPQMVERSVKIANKGGIYSGWLGVDELIKALIECLEENGFKVLDPQEFNIYGADIIHEKSDLGIEITNEDFNKIKDYNDNVVGRMDNEEEDVNNGNEAI